MLRPLLTLGFRAGALRHPAGDFLSDKYYIKNLNIFCVSLNSYILRLKVFLLELNNTTNKLIYFC
jgi:hypothetical protein